MQPLQELPVVNGMLTIPQGWQRVSWRDYGPNKDFTTVRFDGSPIALEADAFLSCMQLQRLDLPESVQSIGMHAFHGCDALAYVTGPGVHTLDGSPIAPDEKPIPMVFPLVDIAAARNTALRRSLALGYLCEPERYSGPIAASYARYAKAQRKALLAAADALGLSQPAAYYAAMGHAASSPAGTTDRVNAEARVERLLQAVLTQSAEDLRRTLSCMEQVEFAPHIVALAARYRGLAHVQALVEAGYTLAYDPTSPLLEKYGFTSMRPLPFTPPNFACALIAFERLQPRYVLGLSEIHLLPQYYLTSGESLMLCSAQERTATLQYLLSLPKYGGVRPASLLYYAILDGDCDVTCCLLAHGTQLSARQAREVAYRSDAAPNYLYRIAMTQSGEVCEWILHTLVDCMIPLGLKPHITQTMLESNKPFFFTGDRFAYIAAHADLRGVTQQRCMELLIDAENTAGLAAAETLGWLKQPHKRDALIAYADAKNRRASLAWLLEYKHRTADLLQEAAREEARINRLLNEKPDSPAAMRRNWQYERLGDGTIRLLSYKGDDLNIILPDHIGKLRVTALGDRLFSPWKQRISQEQQRIRSQIESISIPAGVTFIGAGLCSGCRSLRNITLPESLYEIGSCAFEDCICLPTLRIPPGVVHIGQDILSMPFKTGVSITGKQGSMAHVYAHRFHFPFRDE